ncbi:fasciclin domain-containing protein [Nocardioides litoris]|uniref:fasciclin domain-containing protein n=1 Tax=Nocardioides litoris TaxID=1926648 RepID=UPI00111D3301|nr:fasciclin domain-containing protein [Nocardioides litoris]
MNTKLIRRGTAAAAVLTLSLGLAACGEEDEPTTGSGTSEGTSESAAPAPSESESSEEGGTSDAAFGPACGDLPQGDAAGGLTAMTDQPVGEAASTNPLLKTLVAAVSAVPGLVDTLNDESASYTVFAPADSAFEKIPAADLQGLLDGAAEANSPLATVLQHHVLGERVQPDSIEGEQTPLAGDPLTVEGDPASDPDNVTVTDGAATANIVCGGIQTANATVYVIDTVLTGPLAG